VGLTKFKNTKVSKLSGGQKQRVAIARAMVKDTPIIVADEPTGNLDTESAKEVIEILKKVAKNKLVVVVTHNIEQVEEFATRIIKMHDGRIVENTQIKEIKKDIKLEESKYNKITVFNKYRLGIRNTFNIVSKFVLLFAVFFFIIAALFLEYASFELSEYEASKEGYNMAFRDLAENRIVIKKKDNTSFTEEDYQKIKNLSNIDYIVEDDLFLDGSVNLFKDDISFYGSVKNTENFREKLDIGRMPKNDDEIILKANKEHYYIKNRLEEILNKSLSISNFNGEELRKVTIVGISYNEDNNDYNAKFYISKSVLNELRSHINKSYSDLKVLFNDKYMDGYYNILPSNNVEKGKAVVYDELRYQVSNGVVRNKPLNIYVSNIYYDAELDLKISNTYTKSNFKRLTGYDKYDNYRNSIFINTEDYNSMYDKPSYQSSVFVKDIETIDDTLLELENLGLKAKKITDYKVNGNEAYSQMIRIIKVLVTIVLIFVLFFISYFIIRIILKSRNIYYTTLRMLGATYRNVKKILDIELFINSSIAYITTMILIYLVKINIINFEYVSKLTNYLELREYVLMYLILVVMSQLISRRFAKKLFKNTAINTYNEEV